MGMENSNEMERLISSADNNIVGMVILKNNTTVYTQGWHGYTAEKVVHVFSVTKSIVSALIGIAIDQGYIRSVDQLVLDFFPDYPVKRGEKTIQRITLRHLMTMTAPFKYKSAPYTKYFTSDNWVRASLDLLGGKGMIGQFRYTPLIGPDILSGILTSATGRSMLDFAAENLFLPLGIPVRDRIVFHTKEEQLEMMKNHSAHGWVSDSQGNSTAGWGLFLSAADMGKIGQLYLNHGIWEGNRIISGAWIDESTKVHHHWEGRDYGYLWWVIDENERSFAALGDGGTVIYVNPAKKTVIAIASRLKPNARDRIALIKSSIEPMLAGWSDR